MLGVFKWPEVELNPLTRVESDRDYLFWHEVKSEYTSVIIQSYESIWITILKLIIGSSAVEAIASVSKELWNDATRPSKRHYSSLDPLKAFAPGEIDDFSQKNPRHSSPYIAFSDLTSAQRVQVATAWLSYGVLGGILSFLAFVPIQVVVGLLELPIRLLRLPPYLYNPCYEELESNSLWNKIVFVVDFSTSIITYAAACVITAISLSTALLAERVIREVSLLVVKSLVSIAQRLVGSVSSSTLEIGNDSTEEIYTNPSFSQLSSNKTSSPKELFVNLNRPHNTRQGNCLYPKCSTGKPQITQNPPPTEESTPLIHSR